MLGNLYELLYLMASSICFNYLIYSVINEKVKIKISLIVGTLLFSCIYYFNIGLPGLKEEIVKEYLLYFLVINIFTIFVLVLRKK